MGLTDLWVIAELHCRKVKNTRWLEPKLVRTQYISLPLISTLLLYYSRVHKSSDNLFSKILEKPSIVQKKNDASYEWAAFFTEMK